MTERLSTTVASGLIKPAIDWPLHWRPTGMTYAPSDRKHRLAICALAAAMSAVLKAAAANTDDRANARSRLKYPSLVPWTGERKTRKGLERFFGRDCGRSGDNTVLTSACWNTTAFYYIRRAVKGFISSRWKKEGGHVTSLGKWLGMKTFYYRKAFINFNR